MSIHPKEIAFVFGKCQYSQRKLVANFGNSHQSHAISSSASFIVGNPSGEYWKHIGDAEEMHWRSTGLQWDIFGRDI